MLPEITRNPIVIRYSQDWELAQLAGLKNMNVPKQVASLCTYNKIEPTIIYFLVGAHQSLLQNNEINCFIIPNLISHSHPFSVAHFQSKYVSENKCWSNLCIGPRETVTPMEIALAGKTVDSASVNSDINDDSAPLNANSDGECNESKGNNISLEAQKSGSKEKDLRNCGTVTLLHSVMQKLQILYKEEFDRINHQVMCHAKKIEKLDLEKLYKHLKNEMVDDIKLIIENLGIFSLTMSIGERINELKKTIQLTLL